MLKRFCGLVTGNGLLWTFIYSIRVFLLKILTFIEAGLLKLERKRLIFTSSSLTNHLNTVRDNYLKWNNISWDSASDQWTQDSHNFKNLDPILWKNGIVENFIYKYVRSEDSILEVGPGGGRWTEFLLKSKGSLRLADISDTSLETCRKRFKDYGSIGYHLIDLSSGRFLPEKFISKNSIDFIWSYDVFVHINPRDIFQYIKEFSEVLKPGGIAVIHHAGKYKSESHRLRWFRSNTDKKMFNTFLLKNNLTLLNQDSENAHFPGDIISVFKK